MLEVLSGFCGRPLLRALPQEDAGNLNDTNASEEKVHSGQAMYGTSALIEALSSKENIQQVARFDDQAPPSPDCSRSCESSVLGEGELLGGTGEVRDTGDD